MPDVRLSDIVGELEACGEEGCAFLDRHTGEVIGLSGDDLRAAEDDDPADYPAWQRERIELAKAIDADDGERFLSLPGSFDVNEWEMMRDFASGLDDEAQSEDLLNAIHGRGAFRYFKDRVHALRLADAWYAFRDEQYRRIALEWREANGVTTDPTA
jgi:alpha-acetolactate decarboxylase